MTQVLVWSHYQKEAKLKTYEPRFDSQRNFKFLIKSFLIQWKVEDLVSLFSQANVEMYVKLILTDEESGEIKEEEENQKSLFVSCFV